MNLNVFDRFDHHQSDDDDQIDRKRFTLKFNILFTLNFCQLSMGKQVNTLGMRMLRVVYLVKPELDIVRKITDVK